MTGHNFDFIGLLLQHELLFIYFGFCYMTVSRQVHDSELPTDFAILLAEKFGIYPPADPQLSHELIKRETDLKLFQQMSISGSFEEALLCYYDRDFNDDQLAALKLIYKASFHWLKGEVIGVLINKIKNPSNVFLNKVV